jgi:hypothetical protein
MSEAMMIEIAGGIVLAILFLALLPLLIRGAILVVGIGVLVLAVIGAGWFLIAVAQSPQGLGILLIVAGVFLVWLHYEIKARREIAAEEGAAKTLQYIKQILGPTED